MRKNKSIAVSALAVLALALLAACTPGDVDYCRGFGVEGTAEYGKCISYYHEQEALFGNDMSVCSLEADGTYPPTLYDYGHYEHIMGGYGPRGEWYSGTMIRVEPDYQHNAQVDSLRMRIIAPCMDARGWNSPTSWQAGRHAVTRAGKAAKLAKLPWQN